MTLEADVLTFIKDWLWAPLLALVSWGWTHLNKRIDKVAEDSNAGDKSIRDEINRQGSAKRHIKAAL